MLCLEPVSAHVVSALMSILATTNMRWQSLFSLLHLGYFESCCEELNVSYRCNSDSVREF